MSTPPTDNPSLTVLTYSSPRPTLLYKPQSDLLLLWQIANLLAAPVGLLIGIVGTWSNHHYVSDDTSPLWNINSVEDWLVFLLWLPIALGFITLPITFAIRCGILRRQLRLGDPTPLARAAHLCTLAHLFSALLTLGLLVGFAKALLHSRYAEIVWWIILLTALSILTLAIEYTRRQMNRAFKLGPGYFNTRLTVNPP